MALQLCLDLEAGWCKHRRSSDTKWNWRWFVADTWPDNDVRMTIYKTEAASLSTKKKGVVARGSATISPGYAGDVPAGFSAIYVDLAPLSASAGSSRHTICVPTITDDRQRLRLAMLARDMSAGVSAGGIGVTDRSWHLRVYKQTFLLRDAGAWLTNRVGGDLVLSVGTQLLNLGLIAHVCNEHAFELKEGGGLFFRFSTFHIDALCIPPAAVAAAPSRAQSRRDASTLDDPSTAAATAPPRVALSAARASELSALVEVRTLHTRVAQLESALAAAGMRERQVRLLGVGACVAVLAVLLLL